MILLVLAGFLLAGMLRPLALAAEGQFERTEGGLVYRLSPPVEPPAELSGREDLPPWQEIADSLAEGGVGEGHLVLGPAIAREGSVSLQYQVDVLSQGQELLFAVVTPDTPRRIGRPRGSSRRFGTLELRYPGGSREAAASPGSVVALIYDTRSGALVESAAQPITREPAVVTGSLLQERGAPAADRRVLLCSDFLCFPGHSGENGSFVIEEIPAGAYEIRVGTLDAPVVMELGLLSGERRSLPSLRSDR